MTTNLTTPREIDTALAAKFHELDKAKQQVAYNNSSLLMYADAKYYYRGRQRVTDMRVSEAIEKLTTALAEVEAYKATHSRQDGNYVSTDWSEWSSFLPPYEIDSAQKALDERAARIAAVEAVEDEIEELNTLYTGWSRFFLVTSSTGHVHSSMHCSTCRMTTTYGWLPELSGKTEDEAVAELGPNLCSVCFASAPVEMVGGKISKAQAAKRAA